MINRIDVTHFSQKYQTLHAELFVRYPADNEIYNHVVEKAFIYKYKGEDISFSSQIALDLNQSLLHQNWQKQFHEYLIESQKIHEKQYFYNLSYDMRMTDKKLYEQLKKKQKPKLWSCDWYFISKLREFKDDKNLDILLNCSGSEPLVRSVGLFEVFIQMINQFKKIDKDALQIDEKHFEDIKREFIEKIVYYYMLCQHDQAQLTHYGFQGQVCILLLSFIQIKLILKQLLFQKNTNLLHAIKELIVEFRDNHFAKIINSYFEQEVDANQLIDQMHKLISNKQQEKIQYKWENFLNINTNFYSKVSIKKQILENHIMLLYYCLLYQDKNGQFNWEDPNFFNYLLQKRGSQIGLFNKNIYYPHHNSNFTNKKNFDTLQQYDKVLSSAYTQISTVQYAPDDLFLALHNLSKGSQSNRDIFDIVLDILSLNFNQHCHGPILATILSSYDFNYHENYVNSNKKNRDDFMNHFQRMDLNALDIKNRMLFSQYFLNKMILNQK